MFGLHSIDKVGIFTRFALIWKLFKCDRLFIQGELQQQIGQIDNNKTATNRVLFDWSVDRASLPCELSHFKEYCHLHFNIF